MSRKKHQITLNDGYLQFSRHKKRVVLTEDLGAFRIHVFEARGGLYSAVLGHYPGAPYGDGPRWLIQAAYMQPSIQHAIEAVKGKHPSCVGPTTKSSLKH